MSDHDEIRAFITDPALQQRLAKYMVLQCFRNSMLEDLHAGTSPSSASGDYADVTVTSPFGVIPWPKVSRLNDDEMKRLMIDVVDSRKTRPHFANLTPCKSASAVFGTAILLFSGYFIFTK